MSARKNLRIIYLCVVTGLFSTPAFTATSPQPTTQTSLSMPRETIARQLGWVESGDYQCGGYYLEQPFIYPVSADKNKLVSITSKEGTISWRSTTTLEGSVSISRYGQQITANKAYLFRDPMTKDLTVAEMIGDVHLREPNTLIVGKKGRYNFKTDTKSLIDILYRTTLYGKEGGKHVTRPKLSEQEIQQERRISALTAWGQSYEFSQTKPKVYELSNASYSTCPPTNPAWQFRASHILLDKNTGRGYATHARILVKDVPIFYAPYFPFSTDRQRKSGFLWPSVGVSGKWGPYVLAPIYWNMAPNYDMTFTPGILSKRGVLLTDDARYLTESSVGNLELSILPADQAFADFKRAASQNPTFHPPAANAQAPVINAELNRLLNASNTRKGFSWRDHSRFNQHWSSEIDINYVGDDYFLRDFSSHLNEVTKNQLLQEADLQYNGQNWNFTGRVQSYQTLHQVDDSTQVLNQYRRFPQLVLDGDYPDQWHGLEYFINNEITHFEILNNPGTSVKPPIGNRMHTQPGVSLPLSWPYFYITPRAQIAFTDYNLFQTSETHTPNNQRRTIPIFDIASGLSFIRNTGLFGHAFQQTLEPQIYYTYIPYRNQNSIPVFDTTVNTLTYNQLFNYNRFTGIDRIGDANQMSLGVSTRLIDQETGYEKVRLGVGEIVYFADRRVTLCNNTVSCTDSPSNPSNHWRLSPVSGLLNYNVNPHWTLMVNEIWNPISKEIDNTTLSLHYQPDALRIIHIGYSFVHNGDIYSGAEVNSKKNNVKSTDLSFAWPVFHDFSAVARWNQDWSQNHFQNLLYGVQYDSCCWAVRMVGGKAFTHLSPTNTPQYNSEFYIQFALKGLGNIGKDPSGLLKSINGYNTQFGQEL